MTALACVNQNFSVVLQSSAAPC